jgi:Uma2 family endonuclease
MATAALNLKHPRPTSSGVVFQDVTWNDYEAMLRIVGERPIRVTYNQGTMEVFMPSLGHESDTYLLGRMVDTLTEELEIPVVGGGATTHKRRRLDKGAEPDQCYWLRDNAVRMRGKRKLDLREDLVPDLVIEVDVAHSSLDRLTIFAALGVPEVWRSTGRTVHFLHLQADRAYQRSIMSRNFPTLPAAAVVQYLKEGQTKDTTAWIRSFRAFVRKEVVGHQ